MSATTSSKTGEDTQAMPTRLFQNGNSQAVRIPKDLAFDHIETEVEISRRGDELVIRPVKRKLTGLGAAFRKVGAHCKALERDQPDQEPRDWNGYADAKAP